MATQIFTEPAPRVRSAAKVTTDRLFYINLFRDGFFEAIWETGANSMDYAHLDEPISRNRFILNGEVLQALADQNAFRFFRDGGAGVDEDDLVVFGLRGCVCDAPPLGFSGAVEVREEACDHAGYKCLIGAWRRSTGEIAVFPATTIPSAPYLLMNALGVTRANMMPTGLHLYRVGAHSPFSPTFTAPGSLRQQLPCPVLRTEVTRLNPDAALPTVGYTIYSPWDFMAQGVAKSSSRTLTREELIILAAANPAKFDAELKIANATQAPRQPLTLAGLEASETISEYDKFALAGDNITVAYADAIRKTAAPLEHFSAGLQQIPGSKSGAAMGDAYGGDFGRFRKALGLAPLGAFGDAIASPDDGRQFWYMLLTGRDARLAARRRRSGGRRLRYGSSGRAVERLQRALGLEGGYGVVGARTMREIIRWQSRVHTPGWGDGIVTEAQADKLGASL